MKISDYLKDKLLSIIISIITILFIYSILNVFKFNVTLKYFIVFILLLKDITLTLIDYLKRRNFYNSVKNILNNLDKKYLISEMITNSNFLDGKLFLEYLYEIDKSMHEEINEYKYSIKEFKEYIELWCHEIKTPIATSKLIIENNESKVTNSIKEEIEKIENYIEQVLYYGRSDNVYQDYLINEVALKKVINSVIKKNKKDLISKKIKIIIEDLTIVKSDSKWLEFIVNQIITNSIKYSKEEPYIKISCEVNKNNSILIIEDNGIGIESSEVNKVFDKGFTGTNGRKKYNSTGIGLYLCKKLCNKLGHDIILTSKLNDKTIVKIIFPIGSMTNLK